MKESSEKVSSTMSLVIPTRLDDGKLGNFSDKVKTVFMAAKAVSVSEMMGVSNDSLSSVTAAEISHKD